ncbi:MAG: preprotein translocase subunit SecY, partial [Planctomycetota bacterium]
MLEKLRVVWQIPELKRKIGLTLLMLAIYRIGFQINLPIVDADKLADFTGQSSGLNDILKTVQVLSAAQLNNITIFGLGIMPYISASIIFQLLGSVIPQLEALQKEGEAGRKKINEYTRYATVVLCLIQSWFFVTTFGEGQKLIADHFLVDPAAGSMYLSWKLVAVMTMTCGTVFLMWLGEQIDEYGIGNGISLLIMAGILAQMPIAGYELLSNATPTLGDATGKLDPPKLILLAAIFVAVVAGVVFITLGQRRIPMQSAKHQRGRKQAGGGRSYLPLKVNQAGVMPIIFASSLMMFPLIVFGPSGLGAFAAGEPAWWKSAIKAIGAAFGRDAFVYNITFLALIYFFCYFWTAITFNPKDIAENLRNYGSFIPGYRPGKRTADFLEKVMFRITYVGAGFLA